MTPAVICGDLVAGRKTCAILPLSRSGLGKLSCQHWVKVLAISECASSTTPDTVTNKACIRQSLNARKGCMSHSVPAPSASASYALP